MIIFIDDSGGGGGGGATYRYWRIYVTAVNAGAYLAIQEIELRATPGGPDLTHPLDPAYQSSYFAPDNAVAGKAIDDIFTNPATGCFVTDGSAMPQWGSWDLGSPETVAEFAIWPQYHDVNGPDRAPKDFVIQGSDDNATWVDVLTLTGVSGWTAGTAKTFDLT